MSGYNVRYGKLSFVVDSDRVEPRAFGIFRVFSAQEIPETSKYVNHYHNRHEGLEHRHNEDDQPAALRLNHDFNAFAYTEELRDTHQSKQAEHAQSPRKAESAEHPKKSELAPRFGNDKDEIEQDNTKIERKPRFQISQPDRFALEFHLAVVSKYTGIEIYQNIAHPIQQRKHEKHVGIIVVPRTDGPGELNWDHKSIVSYEQDSNDIPA
jgi:hypothetical protein